MVENCLGVVLLSVVARLFVVNAVVKVEDKSVVFFLVDKLLLFVIKVVMDVEVCGVGVIAGDEPFVADLVLGVVNGPVFFAVTKLLVTIEVLAELVGSVLEVEDGSVCFVVIPVEVRFTLEVPASVEVSLVEEMVGLDFLVVK